MKKHILIVDDEEHLADALAHNLQFEGFSTTIAYDGEEGLNLTRTIQFDLVILDIMMPKLDGLEVCRRLRATGSRVPILFLTAANGHEEVSRAYAPGITLHLGDGQIHRTVNPCLWQYLKQLAQLHGKTCSL